MKTVINIKTDRDVKEGAQRTAKELGLPLSTIINAYLKEFVRKREVTFSIEPQLKPEIEKLLRQASRDYREGRNIAGSFANAEAMDVYLDK